MQLDIVDKFYMTDPTAKAPTFIGVKLGFQTTKNNLGTVRGEIVIQGQDYIDFISSGITEEELAEKKLVEILELDRRKIDAFTVETYDRNLAKTTDEVKTLQNGLVELAVMVSNAKGGAQWASLLI